MDANKQKALDLALGQIEKAFGKEAICKLGGGGVKNVEAIPTGALSLDLALGVGGLPRGRVIEFTAPKPAAKRRYLCTWRPKHKKWAAPWPLLMRNTPWTRYMRLIWV